MVSCRGRADSTKRLKKAPKAAYQRYTMCMDFGYALRGAIAPSGIGPVGTWAWNLGSPSSGQHGGPETPPSHVWIAHILSS